MSDVNLLSKTFINFFSQFGTIWQSQKEANTCKDEVNLKFLMFLHSAGVSIKVDFLYACSVTLPFGLSFRMPRNSTTRGAT